MSAHGWRGPDFTLWWSGDWHSRVEASVAAGVGDLQTGWHWSRIKAAYFYAPSRPPVEEFLRWIDRTKGLARFACASGTAGDPELTEQQKAMQRLFPEFDGTVPGLPPSRCLLVRVRHRTMRRRRTLFALVREGRHAPVYSDSCTVRQFLDRLERRGVRVKWDQRMGEIVARAECLPPYHHEEAGL